MAHPDLMAVHCNDRLDKALLDRLIEQANRQYEWLMHTRPEVAAGIFGGEVDASRAPRSSDPRRAGGRGPR